MVLKNKSKNVFVCLADKLVGMLMDIYACQGDVDKAETLMRRFRSNVVQLTILVKLLGKRDMAVSLFFFLNNSCPELPLSYTHKRNSACIHVQRHAPTL